MTKLTRAHVASFWGAHALPKAFSRKNVVVVVPDATRPLNLPLLLAPLLQKLSDVGAYTSLLVALGLHRPMTQAELWPLSTLAHGLNIPLSQHVATGPFEDLGPLHPDIPAQFNPALTKADLIVCVGVVEPHQYAGLSGGIKTIAIGCASHNTIGKMHGLRFLRGEQAGPGEVAQSQFREALGTITSPFHHKTWAYQVIPSAQNKILFAPVMAAFDQAAKLARPHLFEPHSTQHDWVHVHVPSAKSASFYQASRAATYIALVKSPVVKQGGVILIEAECPEGLGKGKGELAFAKALERGQASLMQDLLPHHASRVIEGGAQRAYVLAKTLAYCRLGVIGAVAPMPQLKAMGITQWSNRQDALQGLALLPEHGLVGTQPFERIPVHQP